MLLKFTTGEGDTTLVFVLVQQRNISYGFRRCVATLATCESSQGRQKLFHHVRLPSQNYMFPSSLFYFGFVAPLPIAKSALCSSSLKTPGRP